MEQRIIYDLIPIWAKLAATLKDKAEWATTFFAVVQITSVEKISVFSQIQSEKGWKDEC
jgi:hypothetical protein